MVQTAYLFPLSIFQLVMCCAVSNPMAALLKPFEAAKTNWTQCTNLDAIWIEYMAKTNVAQKDCKL